MEIGIENVGMNGNRIWIPKDVQSNIGNDFIDVTVTKCGTRASFLTRITKDGRFFVPKEKRRSLNLDTDDNIDLKLRTVSNAKRSRSFLSGNNFDMLSFVPERTMSGFDVLAKVDHNKMTLWYSTKGRPNEIEINRFVPFETARLIGYFMAEGGKPKLAKRRGRELCFTNKSLGIITDFLNLSKMMFDVSRWSASVRYSPAVSQEDLENVTRILEYSGVRRENVSKRESERIASYTIRLWIGSSVLAETVHSMSMGVMRFLSDVSACSKRDIIRHFLQGLIAGDGSLFSKRDKNGSLHTRLYVFESNKGFIEDYARIFLKIGIKGGIRKVKGKNLFIFTSHLNWEMLLLALKYDILSSHVHKKKLIEAIASHRRYKALRYLPMIEGEVSARILRGITKMPGSYNSGWVRDRTRDGILRKLRREHGVNVCELTLKGRQAKRALKSIVPTCPPRNVSFLRAGG